MATKKPRITITLEPEVYLLLRSISDVSGQSMSGIVTEFLDGARPVFESMSHAFGKIKAAKDFEKRAFLEALEESERALSPLAIHAVDVFESSIKNGLEGACRDGEKGGV